MRPLSSSLLLFLSASLATAQETFHAPTGVVTSRTHASGELRVGGSFERQRFEGLREGTTRLSTADAFALGYTTEPLELNADTLTGEAEYGLSPRLSVRLVLPYHQKWMHLEPAGASTFETRTQGLGDALVTGLLKLVHEPEQCLVLALGVSLPSGSVDQRHDVPGERNAKLPYAMQLGSGTFDLLPSATYEGRDGPWSFGAQGLLRVHTDVNDEGYRLGNRLQMDGWMGREVGSFHARGHLRAASWDNIAGRDPELDRSGSTLNEPLLQGGTRLDALLGLEYHDPRPGPGQTGFSFEVGLPVLQSLDGPQLESDWFVAVGWRLAL